MADEIKHGFRALRKRACGNAEPVAEKYGLWTALHEVEPPPHITSRRERYIACRCECGTERHVSLRSLQRGRSTCCGCVGNAKLGEKATKHGLSRNELYDAWKSMNARCYDPRSISWPNYGKRGISVCEEWRHTPTNFIAWATSETNSNPWKPGLTIDRINPNGNYEPANCRFVGMDVQSRNKRNTTVAMFKGRMTPVVDISKEVGIKYTTLLFRLNNKWPTDIAFSLPVDTKNRVSK